MWALLTTVMAGLARPQSTAAAQVVRPLMILAVALSVPLAAGGSVQLSRYQTILLYVLVAMGLNLTFGFGGQLDLSQPVVMGTSAYGAGILNAQHGWSPIETFFGSVALGVAVSVLLSLPGLRLRGWYLAITTFFAALVFPDVVVAFRSTTGGTDGLGGISPLPLGATSSADLELRQVEFLIVVVAILWLAFRVLTTSRWGIRLAALRDCPVAARSCGVDLVSLKFSLAVIAAIPVAVAGWASAHTAQYISPQSYGLNVLLIATAAVLVGGRGTMWGPVFGTILFQAISLWVGPFSPYNNLFLGGGILIIVVLAPGGLSALGRRAFDRLAQRLQPSGEPVRQQQTSSGDGGVGLANGATGRASDTHEVLIDLAGVGKSFGGRRVLRDATAQIRQGRIYGLVGPNGSGKTTLLNILTGFVSHDVGSMRLKGADLASLRPDQVARRGIRRSFQVPQLIGELTVLQNIEFGLIGLEGQHIMRSLLRLPSYRRAAASSSTSAAAICDTLGISEATRSLLAGTLPLGTRRLVEVGRAMAGGGAVVCLDEPAAGLAGDELEVLRAALLVLAASGCAVILIEHNLSFVRTVCDSILTITDGALVDQSEALSGGPTARPIDRHQETRPAKVASEVSVSEESAPDEASSESLVCDQISAWYGQARVLWDVSLTVRPGSVVGLVGSNGAGKTTLLRSIAGLHREVQGTINFGGHDLASMSAVRVAQVGVSLVREGGRVYENLTVAEQLSLAAAFGRSRRRVVVSEADLYDLFPVLGEFAGVSGGFLSGGQRQMLCLASALASGPRCLLLDEPSAGLAESVAEAVFRVIPEIIGAEMVCLIAEQDARWLEGVADSVITLENGRLDDCGQEEVTLA